MSVTYWYNADAEGAYAIDAVRPNTIFGDANASEIPYGDVTGSVTIGRPVAGDVNGDCTVDILDLILMRSYLGKDPASGSNWRYDLNEDGNIDLTDMLIVRNSLYAKCP